MTHNALNYFKFVVKILFHHKNKLFVFMSTVIIRVIYRKLIKWILQKEKLSIQLI